MMLSLNGRPSDANAFLFFLATELGKTVGELEAQLSYAEFVQWQAYHTAKNAIENQRKVV
jgi:hypothetical protein